MDGPYTTLFFSVLERWYQSNVSSALLVEIRISGEKGLEEKVTDSCPSPEQGFRICIPL